MKAPQPDFQALFHSAPGCYLVLSPSLDIVAVSDAYLRATMTRREDILGKPLFEVFPDNPDDPDADGVANLRASLGRVLAERRADQMPTQKYDIRRPDADGGAFEVRYWSPSNTPVFAQDGSLASIIHAVVDVTDVVRLQAQGDRKDAALRALAARNERRYAQLLDAAPDAIVVASDDGRIDFVNAQTETLFGYPRAELIGEPIEKLLPEAQRALHVSHVASYVNEPTLRPMGLGLELCGRHRDGTQIPIEARLSPHRSEDGLSITAAIRDIRGTKRADAALKLIAERLTSAVESMQDAFALFDANDQLVLCNKAYRSLVTASSSAILVGESYGALLDAMLAEVVTSADADRTALRALCLASRHTDTRTLDLRLRDGRSLRVISRPTAEGGVVETIWDLTEDESRATELRTARQEAESASAAKSEFLSSMSHELRTPMNAILGFAQLMQRDKKDPVSPRQLRRVEQILQGGEHLLRLIDDILNLSRIEAGRVAISIEPVELRDVLTEVRDTLDSMATGYGVEVCLDPQIGSSYVVAADRVRLAQVLINLGSNAIKYNRKGGRVTFHVFVPEPGYVRITVEDTGVGIPRDRQEKLFQPFQRMGQEAGPIQGTGIGLVITKRLTELMGGRIGFRSHAGEGSSFWVELKTHVDAHATSVPVPASRPSDAVLPPGDARVVLYVEDNPTNISFMEDLLGNLEGVTLITARSAEEGLHLAELFRPDAILMDINLPRMSGLEALAMLRASDGTRRIPVIALTAAAYEHDRAAGMQAGFYRYLTKPLQVEALLDALRSALKHARRP